MMGVRTDESLQADFETVFAGLPADVIAARLTQISRVDVVADLERIEAPILALHGRHDRMVSSARLRANLGNRPNARVVLLDGPHMLLQVNPLAAAREIEQFWKQLQSRPRNN